MILEKDSTLQKMFKLNALYQNVYLHLYLSKKVLKCTLLEMIRIKFKDQVGHAKT